MSKDTIESDSRQINLEGKPAKRGKIKYRKLFAIHSGRKKRKTDAGEYRADSEAEAQIIAWLREHGIVFEVHGAIPNPSKGVDVNSMLEEILSGFSSEQRELLTAKLKLKKIENNKSVGRYDFKIEGTERETGRHQTYYIEYWGMHNPNVRITKENLRRLYNRLLIQYTFVKKPLKEKYYRALGLNLLSLTRADLKKQALDEKLSCLLSLNQDHLITKYMPKENTAIRKV